MDATVFFEKLCKAFNELEIRAALMQPIGLSERYNFFVIETEDSLPKLRKLARKMKCRLSRPGNDVLLEFVGTPRICVFVTFSLPGCYSLERLRRLITTYRHTGNNAVIHAVEDWQKNDFQVLNELFVLIDAFTPEERMELLVQARSISMLSGEKES